MTKILREKNHNSQDLSLKTMLFNRYLLLRYAIALFFFSNIYWLLNQFISPSHIIIVPIVLIVVSVLATAEQFRLYSSCEERLKITQVFLYLQLISQAGLLILTWTKWFTPIFPIFENSSQARLVVFILILLGLVISLISLKRIQEIYQRKDKFYQYFIQLKNKSVGL